MYIVTRIGRVGRDSRDPLGLVVGVREGRRRGARGGLPIVLLLALLLLLMGAVEEEDLTDGLGGALGLCIMHNHTYTRKYTIYKCQCAIKLHV